MQIVMHPTDPGLTVWPRFDAHPLPHLEASASIGIFDSGVGGLTVARAIARRMPRERILYVADQAHVPYGGRPLEEVRGFAEGLTSALLRERTKAVVMGCNISSAVALPPLRALVPPGTLFGVIEPGARAAARRSTRRRIGVLATEGTVASGAYRRALAALDPDALIVQVACPAFVPLVERGDLETPDARRAVRHALTPIRAAGADVVILGCTHYPFLLDVLREEAAPYVEFIDPAEAVADELLAALDHYGRLRLDPPAPHRFVTSADPNVLRTQLSDFAPELVGSVGQVRWQP